MARTITEAQKVEKLTAKDFSTLTAQLEPGIQNTLVINQDNKEYIGDSLATTLPYTDADDDLRIASTTLTERNTGSYLFALDAGKSICIIKDGTTINFYDVNSGSPMTFISSVTTSSANRYYYAEAIFCATEKAAITGYINYVFLNMVGEAWIVAYNTRNSAWQIEPVGATYSAWATSTAYSLGNRRIPTSSNGYYYEATVAGTSSGTQPTWPTTLGDTVTDGGVTWVCRGRYNNFPVTTSTSVRTLNGYIFVIVGGDIYNSDLDLPDSWNTSDFISTEIYPDNVVALAKFKNYLVAFGQNTIEFFYDAANVSGSPLARQEGVLHNVGCVGQALVAESEDTIYWLSQTSSFNYSIWKLDNFKIEKVSAPEMDVCLSNYINIFASISPDYLNALYLFLIRLNGSLCLCIPKLFSITAYPANLYVDSLFVFDFEKQYYYKWTINADLQTYIGRPIAYKQYVTFLGRTSNLTGLLFCSLVVERLTTVVAGLTADFIGGTPSFISRRLDFNSTQYKRIDELSVNAFASMATTSIGVSRDRSTFTSYTSSSGAYKITRLGRAREFQISFTDATPISDITIKYTEHSN